MGIQRGTRWLALGACIILAGGLLVVALRGSSSSPTASSAATASGARSSPVASAGAPEGQSIESITWRGGGSLPGAKYGYFPQVRAVVPFGDRLLAFGEVGSIPEAGGVWSSTDGMTWNLLTNHDSFAAARSSLEGASADGRGGLWAVGWVGDLAMEVGTGGIWHSTDGVTWKRVVVDPSPSIMYPAIAVANGIAVVTGQVSEGDRVTRCAWVSSDGLSWTRATLPGEARAPYAEAFIAAGGGGFEILAPAQTDSIDGTKTSAQAWHSDDGRTWVNTEPPGAQDPGTFSDYVPTTLLVSDRTIVTAGYDHGVSAIWTSSDGRTWSQSPINRTDPAFGCETGCQPTAMTRVGRSLVAVGYPAQERTTMEATSPVITWVSPDEGRTWVARGSGSPGILPAVIAPFGSDVVMLGERLPVGLAPYGTAPVSSARGTIAWGTG